MFRVYALDSNGAQRCVHRWFTAAPDRTLRLTTHAGLVLTRKERNRLQHALEGNTARHTDWLVHDVLASLDPLITESLEQDCWQGNDEYFGGHLDMDEIPATPLQVADDDTLLDAQPCLGEESDDIEALQTPSISSEDEVLETLDIVPQLSLSTEKKTVESSQPQDVDPMRCKARTWKRGLLPLLPQCSRKPLARTDFCAAHHAKLVCQLHFAR